MQHSHTKEELTTTIINLLLLADFVETKVPKDRINMYYFRSKGGLGNVDYISPNECGTHGCMLGWAALNPETPPVEADFLVHREGRYGTEVHLLNFGAFGFRLFPALYDKTACTTDWELVFGANLRNDKQMRVTALRDMAASLGTTLGGQLK